MSSKYKYSSLPSDDKSLPYLIINFSKFAWCTGSLAIFSFIFCIIWSILYNFEESTKTHCNVFNFLPSISAAIGSFSPQKEVWRLSIFTHVIPRFFIPNLYRKYFEEILSPTAQVFGNIACLFNYFELIALTGLTNWSSSDNYPIHKFCFLTFILTSILYMFLMCYILQRHRNVPGTNIETLSLRMKWKLFIFNISSFLLAAYSFMRHNWYCEPFAYSVFALGEYMVVFSNIAFHMTVCWDFYDKKLIYDKFGLYLI